MAGLAVLEALLRSARPLSIVFREYLDHHELYPDYYESAENLNFERTTYEQFGRTVAEKAEYIRNARPWFERMKRIEEAVAGQFRMEFHNVEQIGFGTVAPIREPVRYEVILPSTWPVLYFKLGSDDVSRDGIKYTRVCVATTDELSAADRKSLAAELKAVEADRATHPHQKAAGTHTDSLAEAIEKLSASIRSQPISVSVTQDTVDVRLVDVHPDLMRRAAGDNEEAASKTGQQARKERPQRKNPAGRPTMKASIFRLQLERWAAGQTEKSCASEAGVIERLLNQQFQSRPKPGVPPVPQWDSIENMIRYRYRRLQNTRNAIKYLMGIRPN